MMSTDEMNMDGRIDNDYSPELDAPVAAIRPSSQIMLSKMLNPIKIIPTDNGLPRDWRGLAELSGNTSETISFLESKDDPINELIEIWRKSQDSGCRHFSELKAFLGVIDRFDVVDDITPLLVSDAIWYKEKVLNQTLQNANVSYLDAAIERNILTIEDSKRIHEGLQLTRYDAFILHSEEDTEFANQIVDKLQNEYNLKLCGKEDLLPGVMFEHEVIGRLIEERCNRFLVLFSPSFLESSANQFLVSYAQASALESRVRKIVPCMYKKCELPPSVRYSFCIVYNRSGKLWNFWDKLSQSLRPNVTKPLKTAESSRSNATTLDLSTYPELTLTESVKWWDADKSTSHLRSYSSNSLDSGVSNGISESSQSTDGDSISITSDAHLITEAGSTQGSKKGSKWYKKIISPIKKKRNKDKSDLKRQAIAE